MKKTYTAILLTLALLGMPGCSTTEPGRGEFRQGAYRPPARAPAFNPSTDSPITTGQPGHVRPPLRTHEPTPERVLPHTPKTRNEPTIWASETPDIEPTVELLGFAWHLPPEAAGSADAIKEMMVCADGLGKAAWSSKEAPALRRLGQPTLDCIAAWALLVCVRDNLITDGRWSSLKTGTEPTLAQRLRERAVREQARTCGGRRREGDAQAPVGWITGHWKAARGWRDAEQ